VKLSFYVFIGICVNRRISFELELHLDCGSKEGSPGFLLRIVKLLEKFLKYTAGQNFLNEKTRISFIFFEGKVKIGSTLPGLDNAA
jgi:hypothetical protein